MKNCPKCAAIIDDYATTCPSCGALIPISNNMTGGYETSQPNNYGGQSFNESYGTPAGNSYGSFNGSYGAPDAGYGTPNGGYGVPPYGGGYGTPRINNTGITPRNIVLCMVLSFITFGFYGLYWMIKLNDEVNQLSGEPGATSGGMVILFIIITCGLYLFYWSYKMGERVDRITHGSNSAVLYLVLTFFAVGIYVDLILMQDTINKCC